MQPRQMTWTWVVIILAVNYFCMHDVIEARTSDVSFIATKAIGDEKNSDIVGGRSATDDVTPTHTSTGSDDVKCTTTDDVITARRALCPAQCRCWPLDGQVLTKLIVNCSGAKFNQSTSLRLSQDLTQLLSRCVSELTDLTIINTPIRTVPEVVCHLSKIRALNFNSNRLTSLPSNCFTRMLNLTSFSATSNRLTSLQVRSELT